MKNFCDWWKKDNRYITLVKSLLLALLPLVCCLVYCAAQGHRLNEVYLPSSEWNDELLYYKQVEAVVNYGYPLGYFGYNESHALQLSFGAWSPVLSFPWIIWGFLFGWNIMSPILCNIALMSFSCFLFVWLVKPKWKHLGILTILFCLYTLFVRYMLSGMPEVICFSMLIIFYSLALNYLHAKKNYKLLLLFLFSIPMTLMRPYLILFMLLPAWLWICEGRTNFNKRNRIAASLALLAATMGLYACINHYLGAAYFAPLFSTDWVSVFFERGGLGGIRYILTQIHYSLKNCFDHICQGFRIGLASGSFFAGYLVCMAVLAAQSFCNWLELRRLRKSSAALEENGERIAAIHNRLLIEAHLAFSFIAMFFALLLMYPLTEGSKHLLTFIAVAIFIISTMETRFYKKAVLVGITFAYFYSYKALPPYDYQVPFAQEERVAAIEKWSEIFDAELVLEREHVPNYENVVMWVTSDIVDEISVNTQWQLLYALPEGFGISCCKPEYIMEHFDSLQCRYLYVQRGGSIEGKCLQSGCVKIAEDENTALFRINP